jgi:hypothetical protein
MSKPLAYQEVKGARREVSGGYELEDSDAVRLRLGEYNHAYPLVIDPVLVYSTYLGGTLSDWAEGVAVDADGSAYVVGQTYSLDFPSTAGGLQPQMDTGPDAFIAKLNPEGTALEYSTFLGGTGSDMATGVAIDGGGNVYVAGVTTSANFPTVNAIQPGLRGGSDGFIAKLHPSGSALEFSTYLGGGGWDDIEDIAVDSEGNVLVVGPTGSSDFPTANAFQPYSNGGDAFVAKIDPSGLSLVYATYLGGISYDYGDSIAVDPAGYAYVAGGTESQDYPTVNAIQPAMKGSLDAIPAKFAPDGSIVYSTFLGGSGTEEAQGVAADSFGNAYVTGIGDDYLDFPSPTSTPPPACETGHDSAFVVKLDALGSAVLYSMCISGVQESRDIVVDNEGAAYLAGYAGLVGSSGQAFAAKLDPMGSLLAIVYLGSGESNNSDASGIAIDTSGRAYVVGYTGEPFPLVAPLQPTYGGDIDAFVVKIDLLANTPLGTDIVVQLNGGLGMVGGIELTFSSILASGDTTVTLSATGRPPPTGFKIVGIAGPPTYYDISTTATYSGPLKVCIKYDENEVPPGQDRESGLRLKHDVDGAWEDITLLPVDTVNNVICGQTTNLSFFAIMEQTVPVGGIAEHPQIESQAPVGQEGTGRQRTLGIFAVTGGVVLLGAAAWYGTRRWLRRRA